MWAAWRTINLGRMMTASHLFMKSFEEFQLLFQRLSSVLSIDVQQRLIVQIL